METVDLGLYEYQKVLVNEALDGVACGEKVCIAAPTAAGKTWIIADLVQQLLATGYVRGAVCCHNTDLLYQAYLQLKRLGIPIGWVAAGKKDRPYIFENIGAPIQLVSIQCAMARLDRPPYNVLIDRLREENSFVIYDEVHRSASQQSGNIFKDHSCAFIGLTATPYSRWMGDYFTKLVFGPTPYDLMCLGRLAWPRHIAPETINTVGIPQVNGDFDTKATSRVFRDNPDLLERAAQFVLKTSPGVQRIWYVCDQLHANQLSEILYRLGQDHSIVLSGRDDRDSAVMEVINNPHKDAINRDIMTTGTDIPRIGAIVLLRPTTSDILYLQMVGRGLRAHTGKEFCWIFDFVGNSTRHTRPECIEEYSFAGPVSKGTREVADKECPDCGHVTGALSLKCAACGYYYQEKCPDCGAALYFNFLICRTCGYDKREAEDKKQAAIAAERILNSLKAAVGKFNIDSVEDLKYNYSTLAYSAYMTGSWRALEEWALQLTEPQKVQNWTKFSLWNEQQAAQAMPAYMNKLLQFTDGRGYLKPTSIVLIMALEFGQNGRAYALARRV